MNEIIISIISTHTLTWSVTCDEICIQHQNLYFNSHAHVERDASWINKIVAKFDFNSHAHVERDICLAYFSFEKIYFNSHAHVERDSSPIVNAYGVVYFNSHAHVERDALLKFSLCQIIGISTHTLTWSVTHK